jgi:HD-like signal output (HDOD) protein
MQKPDVKQVEALLSGIAIPPQPKIVLDLTDICKRTDPEFGETIKLVNSEVAGSAKMIKWINAPLFITNSKTDSLRQ